MSAVENKRIDWLDRLTNGTPVHKEFLKYFFDPNIIKNFDEKDVEQLVEAINNDLAIKVNSFKRLFPVAEVYDHQDNSYFKSFGELSNQQIKSDSHQKFLSMIGKYYGKDAKKLLKDRRNISLFNVREIHVLNQKIFDNLGPEFVNIVLNYELEGVSPVISNILNDDEKMANFKYFYNSYRKLLGNDPHNFKNMFEKFDAYEPLIESIVKNKVKLSKEQEKLLKQVFNDPRNTYNIKDIEDLNSYYALKDKWFERELQKNSKDLDLLKNSTFKYLFNVNYPKEGMPLYSTDLTENIRNLLEHYDLDDFIKYHHGVKVSKQEEKIIEDMKKLAGAENVEDILQIVNQYDSKKEVALTTQDLLKKIPTSFNHSFNDSVTKISKLEESTLKKEEGIKKSVVKDVPIYVLEGKNFAFISSTTLENGISGNRPGEDLAKSWFTYEQGTSHICTSYVAATDTENCFRAWEFNPSQNGITYVFDEFEILAMNTQDISSPKRSRESKLEAFTTQFSYSDKFVHKQTSEEFNKSKAPTQYNEIAINRYLLNGKEDIRFGGKIIPSAIMCDSKISEKHINAANEFTKFLIENGLKPEGYKMPIVVVDKEKYIQKQEDRRKSILNEEIKNMTQSMEKQEEIENEEKIAVEKTANLRK